MAHYEDPISREFQAIGLGAFEAKAPPREGNVDKLLAMQGELLRRASEAVNALTERLKSARVSYPQVADSERAQPHPAAPLRSALADRVASHNEGLNALIREIQALSGEIDL